jgi:hypothetical protein
MTAEEIRSVDVPALNDDFRTEVQVKALVMLREIAAQLAELNERLTPGNFEVNIYDCSFEGSKKAGSK